MENVTKHRDIKLITTEKGKAVYCQNQIITQQNGSQKIYEQSKIIKQAKMNKLVYLGLSILDICEKMMYEYWYIKPKVSK